jgi:hypothetical protein
MPLSQRLLLPLGLSCLLLSGCLTGSESDSGNPFTATSSGTTTGGGGNGGPYDTTGSLGGGGGGNPGTDGVVATPSSAGVFKVAIGSNQTLSITFTSADGNTLSGLAINGSLATLPAGWKGPTTFGCQSVSTGSGCVLNLTYTPTTVGPGSFTLDYIWLNASGSAQTLGSSITINYLGTVHNHILGTASPTGQVNAVVGGSAQPVTVTFDTDDGYSASALNVTTALGSLPAGWSSTSGTFTCATVSTGNGCQLALSYAPPAYAAPSTLTLSFSYVDNAGTAQTGSLNIPFAATTHDTIVGTPAPTGQINAVVGGGSQAVTVTFTTSDGDPASNLELTTNLSALPAGWSSTASSLSCATVSTGNTCQLALSYTPTAAGSGTLALNYTYDDDSGTASSGSLNIAYAATTNDNAVATVSPTGQVTATEGSGTQAVTVTFTTDDGNAATNLNVNIASLPQGWSSTDTTFSCASFGTGSGCQLPLTFAPPATGASGTLSLPYTYVDNAGGSKSGTVSISYASTP